MANPKIEKVNADIARTKDKIAEYTKKLRDLEQKKIGLENEEIVALFRREKLSEDEFAALIKTGRKDNRVRDDTIPAETPTNREEEIADGLEEN